MPRMSSHQIQNWLRYWDTAEMVAIDRICAFDQVHLARQFCRCMNVGVFMDVSDLSIWNALVEMRSGQEKEQPQWRRPGACWPLRKDNRKW